MLSMSKSSHLTDTESPFRCIFRGEAAMLLAAAALCAFRLIPLPFPPISGHCSALPSVTRILNKMLFNFRQAADGLCEPARCGDKPRRSAHLSDWCASTSDNQTKTSLLTAYVRLIGMQGRPVRLLLANCLRSRVTHQNTLAGLEHFSNNTAGSLRSQTPAQLCAHV